MARSYIVVALTATLLSVLAVLHFLHYDGIAQSLNQSIFTSHLTPHTQNADIDQDQGEYLLGVGKGDITGPVAEINFMGYADPNQLGSGLRQRLYSRAFIVSSPDHPEDRIVYLVLDTQSGDTAIRHGILERLGELGGEFGLYGPNNVAVTGTHSHSGPGAWLNYLLPQITSRGFDRQSYEAIVKGAVLSIQRAHANLDRGYLEVASGEILDANVNRSPFAYLANPEAERQRYEHDVDKTMTLLKFIRASDNKKIGSLNWFPVHGTSMLGNNTLVTGDNKGVAARLLEKHEAAKGTTDFIAGFSQANVGDTSPNVLGAFCEDGSNSPCSFEKSLCANNRSEACHGRGPYFGLNDAGTKSCFEIGRRQFEGARKIIEESPSKRISGPVRSLHTYRDFSNFNFTLANGSAASTCSAALGFSFAAGTTDGPGAFDFKQHTGKGEGNPFWAFVGRSLHAPTEEQIACQSPKPVLLDVGATLSPYQWTPNIVDLQLMRIGQLIVIVSPGEATTMSGRRWKEAISQSASSISLTDTEPVVVLGGPANTYTHYIATEEEYGIQRYEGASTLYGPHTLAAYINSTVDLLPFLSSASAGKHLGPGPQPPIYVNESMSFIQPVVYDRPGFFKSFGDVVLDVKPAREHAYRAGESVKATFIAGHPRNNLRLENNFAVVERLISHQHVATSIFEEGGGEDDLDDLKERKSPSLEDSGWERYLTDADWELVFRWRRTNNLTGTSEVDIIWDIASDTPRGQYRILYFGDAKLFGSGAIEAFFGMSSVFEVS